MTPQKYYQEYWQKRKEAQGEPIHPLIPSFLRQFSQYGAILNQIIPHTRILDLGCGDGKVTKLYLEKGTVAGVDVSETALKMARQRGIATKFHDLNNLPLPFEKNSFETVILTDVIEHLLDPLGILKESLRILAKGGKVILTVPNFARFHNRLRMFWGDPLDILHWEKYGDELEHLHWFTKGKLKHLLTLAGFTRIRFIPTGLPVDFIFGKLGFYGLAKMLTVVGEK